MIKNQSSKRIRKASAKQRTVKKSCSFDAENYNAIVDEANAHGIGFSTALCEMIRKHKARKSK